MDGSNHGSLNDDGENRTILPGTRFKKQISRLFGKNKGNAGSSQEGQNDGRNIQAGTYRPPFDNSNTSINPITCILPSKLIPSSKPELKRYRGFSTSISNLFLDESVVCPSAACCGVLSSSRTEHLLHVRNQRRKMNNSEFRSPSRILGISLLLTILGVAATYTIWGFDNSPDENYYIYYNGYDNRAMRKTRSRALHNIDMTADEMNLAAAQKLYFPNIMRFKDYHDQFWKPVETMVQDIWYQNDQRKDVPVPKQETNKTNDRPMNRVLLKKSFWKNQEIAKNIRAGFCILFFLILGCFGRRRRLKTRFAVLKGRSQDDKVYYGNQRIKSDSEPRRKEKYDGACSHTLCGCYAVDNLDDEDHKEDEATSDDLDCMNRGYAKFSEIFCGKFCKMWIQCFSVCALAQEARETRLLLPPKDQRLDYITHQPFAQYFTNIYMLRRNWKNSNGQRSGWAAHFGALSKLSRYILATFLTATIVIILTEKYNPRVFFSWADAVVMLITFAQSFVVLGIVHGIFHKSDLSFDAVIKFFAAGFIIATPMAFFFEAIMINILMIFFYIFYFIDHFITNDALGSWIADHYIPFLAIADAVQAFVVAATVEELCKYYTFRAVEHPDLIFLTGLDRLRQDKKAKIGGNQAYPYSLNNASSVDCRSGSFDRNFSFNKNDRKRNHRGHSPASTPTRLTLVGKSSGNDEDEPDTRTVRQQAAAVTTAMISVAVGLACAENFIYVFFLGADNTQEEIVMLVFRSIFPVHALCAAMQSIGVIKKFLEEGNAGAKIGVGKIVLPAILLHGSFDSALMLINSWIDMVAKNGNGPDPYDLNIAAAGIVISIMLIGTLVYHVKNRRQKAKLKLLEVSRTIPVHNAGDDASEKALELL